MQRVAGFADCAGEIDHKYHGKANHQAREPINSTQTKGRYLLDASGDPDAIPVDSERVTTMNEIRKGTRDLRKLLVEVD